MDFFLFCLLNSVLFLRPAELVPELIDLPIYQCVLLSAVAASYPQMLKKLEPRDLLANPINLCVLGLVFAVPLSHLRHFDFWYARHSFMDFGKTALYYLLFVAVIRNERRLDRFFKVLLVLLGLMTALSLLHDHGYIHLPELDSLEQLDVDPETGQVISYPRLQSTGIFNDPNDFAMILVVGLAISTHFAFNAQLLAKPFWLAFLGAMGYALFLTKSRGGFLALFAAAAMFAYTRWGWKRAAMVGILMLPLVAAAFAMRGGADLESGTGQSRIQLWSEGFSLWKNTLMFGIGHGFYADEVGHVAHNSFVQCYVELGLLGGTLFFGCFYFALRTLIEQVKQPQIIEDVISKRRTSLVAAIVVGAATAMLSLTRSFGVPAYMILGIATTAVQFNGSCVPLTLPQVNYMTARKLAVASAAFVVATYIFIRTMVRWS